MKTLLSATFMLVSIFGFAQPKIPDVNLQNLTSQQIKLVNDLTQKSQSKLNSLYKSDLNFNDYISSRIKLDNVFLQDVSHILSAGQFKSYLREFPGIKQNEDRIRKILLAYRDELFNLKKLPSNERGDRQNAARNKSINDLSVLIGRNNAIEEVNRIDIVRLLTNGEIPALKLHPEKAFELGMLKHEHQLMSIELKNKQLHRNELISMRSALMEKHKQQVKDLIGDVKYSQWLIYRDGSHERKFKNVYKFTNEQYEQFKNIENALAIEIFKIKKSRLSLAEKDLKIQQAKEVKTDKLKKLLSPEQFGKWYNDYSVAETNRIQKK